MKGKVNRILKPLGIEIRRARKAHNPVVSLVPKNRPRGNVLVSYVIDPFLRESGEPISNDHTHHWESFQIAQTFLNHGFSVDVVSYLDNTFIPAKNYSFFVGARTNFQRISEHLNVECVKVVHLDTAHWLFNNHAAYQRLLSLQNRRGVTLNNIKMVEPNLAIEYADLGTVLGNRFTMETYRYAGKPLYRIPISAPVTYDWDPDKDYSKARSNYLWFGSSGFVHKGLDLVLEAFLELPHHNLYICGPIDQESQFVQAFQDTLFNTPNIHTIGWVDVASEKFINIAGKCVGLVYPSCSEGGGGSAITCMHAGIIPILSSQTSVDIAEGCGTVLARNSISEIKQAIVELSEKPPHELAKTARAVWEFSRTHHTRKQFSETYNHFVSNILLK